MAVIQNHLTTEQQAGQTAKAAAPGTIAKLEEKALIERIRQGRQWAFDTLVTSFQDRLLKIAYGITLDHEESREIVQDAFVSAINNISGFRGDSGLGTWLRKITVNHCLNWKRKWKKKRGHWETRKTWIKPAYETRWNPGHYNRRGYWVEGRYEEFKVADGFWRSDKVWVRHNRRY